MQINTFTYKYRRGNHAKYTYWNELCVFKIYSDFYSLFHFRSFEYSERNEWQAKRKWNSAQTHTQQQKKIRNIGFLSLNGSWEPLKYGACNSIKFQW